MLRITVKRPWSTGAAVSVKAAAVKCMRGEAQRKHYVRAWDALGLHREAKRASKKEKPKKASTDVKGE